MITSRVQIAALLVVAAGALGSCRDRTPMGPSAESAAVAPLQAQKKPGGGGGGGGGGGSGSTPSGGVLDSCQQIVNGSFKQTIGSAGGTLTFGPVTLSVPAGALSKPVSIQAKIPGGSSVNVVQFKPDGLIFQQPASLTVAYWNCAGVAGKTLKVAQVSDSLQILQYLQSATDTATQTVTGALQHFSNYAVAW
jgi:hypothetical protein